MSKFVITLLLSLVSMTTAAPSAEEFTTMPGLNGTLMKSPSYSGYLDVTESKALHYVFTESMSADASKDPVVVWFNGGPGCSSLLGFFQEMGPWIMDDGEDWIKENPYPWNKNLNMLFIESPAGVGFSKAEKDDDWSHSDMSTSKDAWTALQAWYNKFPEFISNDLFVTGESYGGIYVPYLAW